MSSWGHTFRVIRDVLGLEFNGRGRGRPLCTGAAATQSVTASARPCRWRSGYVRDSAKPMKGAQWNMIR